MGRSPKRTNHLGQWECSKCHEWKYDYEFYQNKRTSNGLSAYCQICQRADARYYSKTERDKRAAEREELARLRLLAQLPEFEQRLRELQQPLDDWVGDISKLGPPSD